MSAEEFKRDLLSLDVRQVYNKYLLGNDIWFFKEHFPGHSYEKYDKFKYYILDKLGIHFNNIAILGSAKTGYSLSEEKDFKLFDEGSDIDLVLVSSELFHLFWKAYIEEHNKPAGIKNGKYRFVASGVFRKFITFEGFDFTNEIFNNWEKKTSGFQKDLQLMFQMHNKVNYRIYESWEAVETYYIKGLEGLKSKLERDGE